MAYKLAGIAKHNSSNEWWLVWFHKNSKQTEGTGFGFPTEEAAKNALQMARFIKKHRVTLN